MGLPITILESVLHSEPGFPFVTDNYLIEVKPEELVRFIDLVAFWNANHAAKKVEEAKDEHYTKDEKKLQTKQKVEELQTSKECRTERDRPDNKEETVQRSKPASQKPKRRRVSKS